jgi:hypothetical protein
MNAKELRDPFTSPARRQETKERSARNRKILKYGLIGAVGLLILVALVYFAVFSGTSSTGNNTPSPGGSDAQTLAFVEMTIRNGNANHSDPSVSSAAKERWQKDLIALEKQRDELLKKNPGLKK